MLIFAVSRWPGMLPQNFSAAHALLFCAAFWLPGWMGWVLPLATIIVTDILLNVFAYDVTVLDPRLVTNWMILALFVVLAKWLACLLYTSPSPRDYAASRMPSSA